MTSGQSLVSVRARALSVREDAAVAPEPRGLIRRAVVIGVEDDLVLVGVHVLGDVREDPPVAGDPEVRRAVVGAEQVDAADPDDVGVDRVDLDDVVVPALAVALGAEAPRRVGDVGEQQRVERVGPAQARLPGGAAVGRAEDVDDRAEPAGITVVGHADVHDVVVARGDVDGHPSLVGAVDVGVGDVLPCLAPRRSSGRARRG